MDKAVHGCASRYSARDAKATYELAMALKERLETMSCNPDGALGMDPDIAQALGLPSNAMYSMWDLYLDYWQPFGKLLTDMEAEGFNVDRLAGFILTAYKYSQHPVCQAVSPAAHCHVSWALGPHSQAAAWKHQYKLHRAFMALQSMRLQLDIHACRAGCRGAGGQALMQPQRLFADLVT